MGRGRATSCSSSTIDSSSCRPHHPIVVSSSESYPSHHSTDLSLALSISASPLLDYSNPSSSRGEQHSEWQSSSSGNTLFVKVYMEGIPIGRKLDLLAHDGYDALVATLDQMFRTNILWAEEAAGVESKQCHVLTYEDKEGDWLMVGDVPWEMFLTSARRLRITRIDKF